VEIKDLPALKQACKRLGLEFREGQKTYKWWGRSVGVFPLPQGYEAKDLGKCEHALHVVGNDGAYEVGVVRRRDGKPGYALMWDFYAGGRGLEAVVGKDCQRLRQLYAVEAAKNVGRKQGMRFTEHVLANGSVQLKMTQGAY
jgi:hypothetical protein